MRKVHAKKMINGSQFSTGPLFFGSDWLTLPARHNIIHILGDGIGALGNGIGNGML